MRCMWPIIKRKGGGTVYNQVRLNQDEGQSSVKVKVPAASKINTIMRTVSGRNLRCNL
jgi:hypothetical protein